MTLKYIWRSFQPRLSFPRPFQLSLACFRVARSPSNSWASCIIRPPVRSNGRSSVLPVMLSFFRHSFSEVPRTIALKLCHMVGMWCNFITPLQKFRGLSPKKIWGPKTYKISVSFGPLQTLIANISETAQYARISKIGRRYKLWEFLLRLIKKSGELWSTNGLEFHVSLDPLKCTFSADYISAHRGYCAVKVLHPLEIDQGYLAHSPTWTGVPPKILVVKI